MIWWFLSFKKLTISWNLKLIQVFILGIYGLLKVVDFQPWNPVIIYCIHPGSSKWLAIFLKVAKFCKYRPWAENLNFPPFTVKNLGAVHKLCRLKIGNFLPVLLQFHNLFSLEQAGDEALDNQWQFWYLHSYTNASGLSEINR